jgi:hypothetical protein
VQKVKIEEVASILKWLEFTSKTMKIDDTYENQKQQLLEALACQMDYLELIKLLYLHPKTCESYSQW